MSSQYFSQRPSHHGEWANFARRSGRHAVVVRGLPAGLTEPAAARVLSRFRQREATVRIGTNEDGSWALKAVFFTRWRAFKCRNALERTKPFGPGVTVALSGSGGGARGADDAQRSNAYSATNVLAHDSCVRLLNATLGFDNWSSSIVSLKAAFPPPPAAGAASHGGGGGGGGGASSSSGGGGASSSRASAGASRAAAVPAPAAAAAAAAAPLDDGWDGGWAVEGEGDDAADGASAGEHTEPVAPVGAAELGLIAMARATFQRLPAELFDFRCDDRHGGAPPRGAGGGGYDDDDDGAEGAAPAWPQDAAAAGGDDWRGAAAAFAPTARFYHQAMFIERDTEVEGAAKPIPHRPGVKALPRRALPRKPAAAQAIAGLPGPHVHATVALSWRNPDGQAFVALGKGGCGCGACLAGGGSGFTAPIPTGLPAGVSAGAGGGGDEFSGFVAEAAQGRALSAAQLRELSLQLTAQLSANFSGGGSDSFAEASLDGQGAPVSRQQQQQPMGGAPSAAFAVLRPGGRRGVGEDADVSRVGLFSGAWAAKEFDSEALARGVHSKSALTDALRDACAGVRVWVPPQAGDTQ